MSLAEGCRRLAPSEIDVAAVHLARAFHDDPYFVYVLPDEVRRAAAVRRIMGMFVDIALPGGHVYTTPGAPVGVAAFVPPGHAVGLLAALAPTLRRGLRVGPGTLVQLLRSMGELEPWHPVGPHWHLFVLGVDPEFQGRGIPAALMAGVLARVDQEGLPVYLETMRASNVDYYARFGFAPRGNFRCFGGAGPEAFTMIRVPR